MSIPPTFPSFDAFVRHYTFLAIETMGCLRGKLSSEVEKMQFFKLNLQNFVHIFCQHFTENPLFFSNEILAIIMSVPPTFPFFFYDIAYIMSIPLTFPDLMPLPNYYTNLFFIEEKTDLSEGRVPPQKLIEIMQFSNSICTGTRRYSDTP